ncbi:hypothetical protein RHSIM_Rhsim04G0034500 [Rhododendron simsii]|uniref:non-specific serine/threonine protein kinase n=1 Tax=Rhododendron simsii TaxID=118357 RepID=A0A834LPW6_RHOSS|nr:hypothetical protein RHSIM_Rhsim04G0034500 [Rhododendron simsii]
MRFTEEQLKSLNLRGTLPAEFANLTFLKEMSLLGNRINGSIPREIGDIATLEELVLEDNQLGGPLPPNLGSLTRLRRLLLSANNFTGPIPEEFSKLTNLTDFRIDGNTLSGKIPDMIGNWTKIDRLDMQGTSFSGPIPSTISDLINLKELRISDLSGSDTTFPDLQNMTKLKTLVLRNCLITDRIPDYIGDLAKLKYLYYIVLACRDLSFNNLSGQIPGSLQSSDFDIIDVSYNNFTESSASGCQASSVNLVSSHSSTESNSIEWCVKKDLPCSTSPKYHSLYINCGGSQIRAEGNEYEEDLARKGPSYFFASSQRWAYSSTGFFMGNGDANFLANNSFSLNITGAEYYKTARLSPNSLKYYGLCLRKGSYKVRLHFAEIMYSDDQTYSSLGRRFFDVSIQGKEVLKDFNIKEEAKGVGVGITREFDDILVNGSTLEIHLYWRGKGTTAIPDKGVYGPLISAITVTPNFDVSTGLSKGAIVGIVVASFVLLVLILVLLRMKGCLGGKDLENKGYSLQLIRLTVVNFEHLSYKQGVLSDGAVIAVKQLSSKSKQGNREFVNEIGMISALQHPHLVKLYGCCIEGNQLLLIYEYMENNCLARALFDKADVYSFGIVALEIVSGKSNTNYRPKEDFGYLLDWALVLKQNGNMMELVDPKLGSDFNKIEVTGMINVALMCTNVSPAVRPAMSSVVSMLEGRTVPETSSVLDPDASNEQMKLKGMMIELQKSLETDTSEGQIQIVPTDGPYTVSSASAGDLYPYTASFASGSWVRDPSYPLYNSTTCPFIEKEFDCQKNGRSDRDYLQYRWHPTGCNLERFDGVGFLKKFKGKKIMFVGDSLVRDQWQSLTCLLYNARPNLKYTLKRSGMISTFTIKMGLYSSGRSGDEGHRTAAFEKALATWGTWVDINIDPSKTRVFFQGISPNHYRGSEWNERGANKCQGQTTPLSGSKYPGALPPAVAVVRRALSKIKKPVTLLDITSLSQLRKDGHPSIYGNSGGRGLDCTHWCVAGVPDTWNQILFQLISHEK